jgi:GxxExxY protein
VRKFRKDLSSRDEGDAEDIQNSPFILANFSGGNVSIDDAVTERIIGCAYSVANVLGPGFLEKVYENALAHELRKAGFFVTQQHPIEVLYDGVSVGEFIADLVVDGTVILELKACREHSDFFTAQCLNYLKATGKPICLLVNFGRAKIDVRRYARKQGFI